MQRVGDLQKFAAKSIQSLLTLRITLVTVYEWDQRTGRPRTGIKRNTGIRVDLNILHQARVAAVTQRKTLGQWLEEAIVEKIDREQKLNKGVQK